MEVEGERKLMNENIIVIQGLMTLHSTQVGYGNIIILYGGTKFD